MSINEGTTQAAILTHILEYQGNIKEPDLRRAIKKELELNDDSNIKRHIRELSENGCIYKLKTSPGKANEWDIKNKGNLKNIKKRFPEYDLKIYQKSIDILDSNIFQPAASFDPSVENLHNVHEDFMFMLQNSESMFWALVENDFNTLFNRWTTMYAFDHMSLSRNYNKITTIQIIENAIKHYVRQDIASGCESPEADAYIQAMMTIVEDN